MTVDILTGNDSLCQKERKDNQCIGNQKNNNFVTTITVAIYFCRLIIMAHVQSLRFHYPKAKHYKKWEHLINRKNYVVDKNT